MDALSNTVYGVWSTRRRSWYVDISGVIFYTTYPGLAIAQAQTANALEDATTPDYKSGWAAVTITDEGRPGVLAGTEDRLPPESFG